MPHVFERESKPVEMADPCVPQLKHVNIAKDAVYGSDNTRQQFERKEMDWRRESVQLWNPFAALGSEAAKHPRAARDGTSASSPYCYYSILWQPFAELCNPLRAD